MSPIAVMWIRDGVLVDRMHINPVAFAFSYLAFVAEDLRAQTSLEDLINFGFEKSGYSCSEKMRLYNQERSDLLRDVDGATKFYNDLAAEAASDCSYFSGVIELVKELHDAGVQNFITSAVLQEALDTWQATPQGLQIAPYLQEILGKRQNFVKGPDHFAYVAKLNGNAPIYYVADAVSEIAEGRKWAREYNLTPVGFANVISRERVLEAVDAVINSLQRIAHPLPLFGARINPGQLSLPGTRELHDALNQAGAETIVSGPAIISELRTYLVREIMPIATSQPLSGRGH